MKKTIKKTKASEIPAPISAPIGFTITLGATSPIHAMQIYHSLVANGVNPSSIQTSIARAGAPSVSVQKGEMGEHQTALAVYLGKPNRRPTINQNMITSFGLVGDREEQCQKFLSLLESGKVVRVGTSWKHGSGLIVASGDDSQGESDESASDDGSDILG